MSLHMVYVVACRPTHVLNVKCMLFLCFRSSGMNHLSPKIQNGTRHTNQSPSPTSCLCGLPTYPRSQTSPIYTEPFLMTGYRKPDPTFFECIHYTFACHNDVWNFWTHFVPLCTWVPWLFYLSYHYDFTDPYYYPLLCFWIGSCSYVFFSSMAHLFGCVSSNIRSICFMLDYLGISVYVAGSGLCTLYHQPPLSSPFYPYQLHLVWLHLLLCFSATLMSCWSRFYWFKYRFYLRSLCYLPAYCTCIAPFLLRVISCFSVGEECMSDTLYLHFISIALTWLLLFFFVTKIPERFAPGKFDIFFQSHTLFHLSSVALTTIHMYILPLEAEARKAALLTKISPSFGTVILPFLTMISIGLIQVAIFSCLVVKGVLISNKIKDVNDPSQMSNKLKNGTKQD